MPWNWELPDWPNFHFNEKLIDQRDKQFLLEFGQASGVLKYLQDNDFQRFVVEILSDEGLESSRIEGEFLDRESLQSSIKQQFGLNEGVPTRPKEEGMATALCDVYRTYKQALTHDVLYKWHHSLFMNSEHLEDVGNYRSHSEPMQIVSNRQGKVKVYYEAPPLKHVFQEMTAFIAWFNHSKNLSILTRAAVAHLYFECIHPFEDGNGRIGRLLIEKVLSQGVERPMLISVSKVLEKRKKEYYAALERCNRTLEIDHWLEFFSGVILQAQKESMKLLAFLINKTKLFEKLKDQLNPRQEKVLIRMFKEGPEGFVGGLSADNYISITKASRATATRDLADLVEKRALIRTGELRHTRYWLNRP